GQLLDRGFDLAAALRKDRHLDPEQRYQIGFALIERRNPAGEEILSDLAGSGRSKVAAMAKAKLKSAGYACPPPTPSSRNSDAAATVPAHGEDHSRAASNRRTIVARSRVGEAPGDHQQEGQMTVDHSMLKLGKKPAHHDPRTLQMANYLELPPIPPAQDWTV